MRELFKTPYVSINGSTDYWETKQVVDALEKPIAQAGARLLLGVQTSHTTQVEKRPNSYGEHWFPVGARGLQLIANYRTVLHINARDKTPDNVEMFTNLVLAQCRVVRDVSSGVDPAYGIVNPVHAVQYNQLSWHTTDYTEHFERTNDKMRLDTVILQVGEQQTNLLSPQQLTEALKPYAESVSHVLLDNSYGKGIPLSQDYFKPYVEALINSPDSPSVAIAGGLTADNIQELLGDLLRTYPSLSVDADSGLRDNFSRNSPAESRFSVEKATKFAYAYANLINRG